MISARREGGAGRLLLCVTLLDSVMTLSECHIDKGQEGELGASSHASLSCPSSPLVTRARRGKRRSRGEGST